MKKTIDLLEEKRWHITLTSFARGMAFYIPLLLDMIYLSAIKPEGVAGVGVITPILIMFQMILGGLSRGAEISGQKLNHDSKKISIQLKSILLSSFVVSFLCAFALLLLFFPIVNILNKHIWQLESNIWLVSHNYMYWISPIIISNAIYHSILMIFRVNFQPHFVTILSIISAILNATLNTVFMLTLITNTRSAARYLALATVISSLMMIVIALWVLLRFNREFVQIRLRNVQFGSSVKKQLDAGLPLMSEAFSTAILYNVLVSVIARHSTEALAGFSFVQSVMSLFSFWASAVGYWVQSYSSQAIYKSDHKGECGIISVYTISDSKKDILLSYFRKALLFSTLGILLIILLYFFFIGSALKHSQVLYNICLLFFVQNMFLQLGRLLNVSIVPVLSIAGENKFIAKISLLVNYLYYLPALLLVQSFSIFHSIFSLYIIAFLIFSDEWLRMLMNGLKLRRVVELASG